MKTLFTTLLVSFAALTASAQQIDALEQLKADPQKSYGTDYPYRFVMTDLTPTPAGYQPLCTSRIALLLECGSL